MTWRCTTIAAPLAAWLSLGLPPPDADLWRFALGRADERLAATASDRPAQWEPVRLPHRIQAPNQALWYRMTMHLPARAALDVVADDGAQVFVDGVRWHQQGRLFYPPVPVSDGAFDVTVRVLNNAMAGGLRRVTVVHRVASPEQPPALSLPPGFAAPESPTFRRRMPPAGAACDFTLWADSQGGWRTFADLVARMTAEPMHFSAGVGDLVDDGSAPQAWGQLVQTLAPLARTTAVVPIPGNHDYDGFYETLESRWFHAVFRRPVTWTAWSCGPARFVALDMNREFPIGISPGSRQHAWLAREVDSAAWRQAQWRILLVHQPPYSVSWAGYEGDEAVRAIVHPLVEHHGLHLVVSGHSHAYEHLVRTINGRRLDVLVTGGAGGALEQPVDVPPGDRVILEHHFLRARADGTRVTVTAEDRDGGVLDQWTREAAAR